jgi:hypothetical protein
VWVETRFRIVGKAVLQLGFDYNRDATDKRCDIYLDGDQDGGWCEARKSYWQVLLSSGDGPSLPSSGETVILHELLSKRAERRASRC